MIRIYAAIALALILSALLYGAVHVWRKAERVDVAEAAQHDAEAALVDEKKGRADDVAQMETNLAKSEAERKQFAADNQALTDRFHKPPPNPKTLASEVKVPNEPCPSIRVSADFVGMWNSASSP